MLYNPFIHRDEALFYVISYLLHGGMGLRIDLFGERIVHKGINEIPNLQEFTLICIRNEKRICHGLI